MILEKIGNNIREIRQLRKFSHEGFANKLNKSENWLQQIEKGQLDLKMSSLELIAKELNVTPEQLISITPSQVFNNCIQSGVFNYSVINSKEVLETIIKECFEKLKL